MSNLNSINFDSLAAFVRLTVLNSAARCMELGKPNNDSAYLVFAEELLAFYSMMACRFLYMAFEIEDTDKIISIYEELRNAFQVRLNERLDSTMLAYKVDEWTEMIIHKTAREDSFNNTFWAYWNGDLDALRISPSYIGELAKSGMPMPSEAKLDIVCFAVIVRCARMFQSSASIIPSKQTIQSCSNIFQEDGEHFNKAINAILTNYFKKKH